ncbi:hypothetical protein M0R72_00675 [Candidatus Pacearchaeota archaeon]|jgi:hypothetical protein|nr:hypothetical protein [Candidatus Pacearchaeota archaeon]
MSNKAPDSACEHCERASERLRKAAELLEKTDELRLSVARINVSLPPPKRTSSVVLIRDVNGDLRVKD